LGGAALGVPRHLVLRQDTGLEERLHEAQYALVPDPMTHTAHEGRVVDLVEARRDVTLEHPGVALSGEHVDLGDGVVRPATRTEAVGTGLEVRLIDRLEHQLQRALNDAIPNNGNS